MAIATVGASTFSTAYAEPDDNWWSGFDFPPAGKGLMYRGSDMAVYDGALVVGGAFEQAGNNPSTDYIGSFNGNGWTGLQGGMDDYVTSLHVLGDDLYAGGEFLEAGTAQATRVARWNGSSWSALGTGTNDTVASLGSFQGRLVAGGWFETAGGVASSCVAIWNGAAWESLDGGVGTGDANPVVLAICEFQGSLIVGGRFTDAGGIPATHLARWDGAAWSSLGANLVAGSGGWLKPVEALGLDGDGNLLVAGDFSSIDGVACNGLAKWDGAVWTGLGAGLGSFAQVADFDFFQDRLVVFGYFELPGGCSMAARWGGASWEPLGSGLNPYDLFGGGGAVEPVGNRLYFCGNIGTSGAAPSAFIARWEEPATTGVEIGAGAFAEKGSMRVHLFGNPAGASSRFVVENADENAALVFDLVDVRGRRMLGAALPRAQDGRIDLAWSDVTRGDAIPAGIYFVRVSGGGRTASAKVEVR